MELNDLTAAVLVYMARLNVPHDVQTLLVEGGESVPPNAIGKAIRHALSSLKPGDEIGGLVAVKKEVADGWIRRWKSDMENYEWALKNSPIRSPTNSAEWQEKIKHASAMIGAAKEG